MYKRQLTGYLRGMGQLPKEERAEVGKTANIVRNAVESALANRKEALAKAELLAKMDAEAVDITLPGRGQQVGTRHLISGIIDEISDIFLGMGYSVASGTEAETDYYNFEAQMCIRDSVTGANFPTAIGVLIGMVFFIAGLSALLDRFARYHFKRMTTGVFLLLQIAIRCV